jgi:hypothetical protein
MLQKNNAIALHGQGLYVCRRISPDGGGAHYYFFSASAILPAGFIVLSTHI